MLFYGANLELARISSLKIVAKPAFLKIGIMSCSSMVLIEN